MKKILVVALFNLLLVYPLFSQGTTENRESGVVEKDLYLSDDEFIKNNINKLDKVDGKFILKNYMSFDDPEIKIYILQIGAKKGFGDPDIVKMFDIALEDGIANPVYGENNTLSKLWRVRVASAYLLSENQDGLDNDTKYRFVHRLIRTMKSDPEERCRAMAAIAIGKLYEKVQEEKAEDKKKDLYARYNVLRKDTIVAIVNERLRRVTKNEQFLCWGLVKSLGHLKSKQSFYILIITRKRGFNEEVMLEISRSLNAITNN